MKKISLSILSVGVLCLIVGVVWLIYGKVEIRLNGNERITATVLKDYHDAGITVTKNDEVLLPDKYEIKEENNVDTSTLGEYKILYDVDYHGRKFHVERIVEIVDDVEPEIEVTKESIVRDYCSKKDLDTLDYKVIDNYDGDLTDDAMVKEEDDNYIITVTDKSGNTKSVTIPITYTEKPSNIFKLNGYASYYVTKGSNYQDAGVTYTDGCGKKIDDVQITGKVDTSNTGEYTISYIAEGKTLSRKVTVYNPNAGANIGTGEKIIYLTFDDGPGAYTEKVLETLAKYNVKATFFVTHQFAGYVPLIKKEYEQGHVVAVHSYTHNWNIYTSVDAYVNDFNKMNDDIEKYTGARSKLFRFPGGSSNTISRNYSIGVVRAIASYMNDNGYVYFDWDVDSGDAAGASRNQIYNNVVSGAGWCSKCVVLMHDIKPNTVNELDNILNTLTSRGYKFGTLSTYSPTMHHSIAN